MEPIGRVEAAQTEAEDDNWGGAESRIVLADRFGAEALDGIEAFSHAEIVFLFDRVDPAKVVTGARHLRNNPEWPLAGIFAQRGKNRPNRIGTTICRIVRREEASKYRAAGDAKNHAERDQHAGRTQRAAKRIHQCTRSFGFSTT